MPLSLASVLGQPDSQYYNFYAVHIACRDDGSAIVMFVVTVVLLAWCFIQQSLNF